MSAITSNRRGGGVTELLELNQFTVFDSCRIDLNIHFPDIFWNAVRAPAVTFEHQFAIFNKDQKAYNYAGNFTDNYRFTVNLPFLRNGDVLL
jgi:hypothetical protein